MHLPDALAELGALLGVGALAFNEHGLCRVQFDGDLTVDFESADDGATLHLCGSLGATPPADSAAVLYETLLHANFLGEGTGGACIALDDRRGELLMMRTLAADRIDFTALAAAVESFVNYYDGWRRKVAEQGGGAATRSSDGPPSDGPLPMQMRV